ncbi:yojK, partial [Symbiodinium pilosum]
SGDVFSRVDAAVGSGQEVVYVSLGTALTGSHSEFGWSGTAGSAMTGKELCQAVYRAVFAELASTKLMNPAPLIVVSTGVQPDALEGIQVPDNGICAPSLPQVELLRRARPVLFVTHGGQNSFMESLTVGTPMLVCPGFGDQLATAAKAEQMGLGLKVDRPKKQEDGSGEVISNYEAAIAQGLQEMLGTERSKFASAAQSAMKELEQAGGTERAAQLCLEVAEAGRARS